MDSITQATLGAAVGYMVAGRRQPRKALLYGAAFGTLPDLDILIHYANEVDNFTRHRGFSHSWIVQTLVAPLFAWCCRRLDHSLSFKTWLTLIWLVFITHAGLDALTVYGTQLFWPLAVPPVMGGSVFIIDPAYTLPLLLLVFWISFRPRTSSNYRAATLVMAVSTLYLGASLAIKHQVEQRVAGELARQQIHAERFLVSATPFNILLWRIVAIEDGYYHEGFASVFDTSGEIRFSRFERGDELMEIIAGDPQYQRLAWFSHGFHAARKSEDQIVITDLRMGTEPVYIFNFALARYRQSNWESIQSIKLPEPAIPGNLLLNIWHRIWNPDHAGGLSLPGS